MKLVQKVSDRKDNNGNPFTDLFLVWEHDNKEYSVRVRPCFSRDYKLLLSEAAKDTQQK